ncbi:MAG: cation:proton antiporter [Mycobacteriales bacterium]
MHDVEVFAVILTVAAAATVAAVLSNRVSEHIRVPAPVIFLIVAAIASDLAPGLGDLSVHAVQRVVTLALAVILFDGGLSIGRRRMRDAAGAVVWIGVAGTFVTAAAMAVLAHWIGGFAWKASLLLGTALAPTDPAVVFSVLGRREIAGRAGTILEGESGANDPVGIALMVVLLTASGSGARVVGGAVLTFVLQMLIGAAVGVVGGVLLLRFMRRVSLPNAGLYPIRVLACALLLYGVATIAHGSGFLAVFAAGIVIGDERAPYKAEIERFHSSLASLGEIVAFAVLGLTVTLSDLGQHHVWLIGLALAVLLAAVVRPLLVGLLTVPITLARGERIFILCAGLKGAVPILLGTFVLTADGVAHRDRIYGVIFIVVAVSVLVQGSLVPGLAARVGLPMHVREPEPWAVGLRLRDEPEGLRRYVVGAGTPADGSTIDALPVGEDVWISLVTRAGVLVPIRGDTVLVAGDEVLLITDPAVDPRAVFRTG